MRSSPAGLLAVLLSLAGVAWALTTLPQPPVVLVLVKSGGQSASRGPMEMDGLPRLFTLSDTVYSGGKPDGEAGFQSLKDLGVRTVISVDGEEPDVAAAEATGIRYVHLPIGYDSVPRARIVAMAAALRELPGPVYIHCHRGLHRGPAAAVAACRAAGMLRLSGTEVDELLHEMGTASKYTGLYRDAREAKPLSLQERRSVRSDTLPSRSSVGTLTQQMVELEQEWERWEKSVGPEIEWTSESAATATTLAERLLEAGRLMNETPEHAALRGALIADGRWLAETVESRSDDPQAVTKLMKQRCDTCHARFRDH
ncbi:MAG TPA: sulfur transferase domain-containing protein [Planctomycetaceae bacterium]|nr:sulfur transferase domain-containing protein [Planctomycetaceae bacterium]